MEVRGAALSQEEKINTTLQEKQFLEECCERDANSWVRPGKLYRSYLRWCEENDLAPRSLNQIASVWQRLGLRRTTVKGYPRLWGVRLMVEGNAYDSFTMWLKKQCYRDDPVGMLAREVRTDRDWPTRRPSLELYETYLRGYGSPEWYLDILRSAWLEWLEYRAHVSKC